MEDYTSVTPEQMERFESCKSSEELLELLKTEGFELDDDQLRMISGGEEQFKWSDTIENVDLTQCPHCGSKNVYMSGGCFGGTPHCRDCGRTWSKIKLKIKNPA